MLSCKLLITTYTGDMLQSIGMYKMPRLRTVFGE